MDSVFTVVINARKEEPTHQTTEMKAKNNSSSSNCNTMKIEMLIYKKFLTEGKTYIGESGTCKIWNVENDVKRISAVSKDGLGVSYRYRIGPANVETLNGNISVKN